MGTRLRLFLIFLGGLLVLMTWTYPAWRPEPRIVVRDDGFPGLDIDLQDEFLALPADTQRSYLRMYQQNSMRATAMVRAHLTPPGDPIPELSEAPNLSTATLERSGQFGPLILPETDERDEPDFNSLYAQSAGQVAIYQYPDGTRLLRIEDLDIINGPDLWVAISPQPLPIVGTIAELGATYIDIAALQSNTGSHNYFSVPDATNVSLNDYATVVIYDRTYQVIFAIAPIQ